MIISLESGSSNTHHGTNDFSSDHNSSNILTRALGNEFLENHGTRNVNHVAHTVQVVLIVDEHDSFSLSTTRSLQNQWECEFTFDSCHIYWKFGNHGLGNGQIVRTQVLQSM